MDGALADDVILVALLYQSIALGPFDGGSIDGQFAFEDDGVWYLVGLAILELANEGDILLCVQAKIEIRQL
jgi:hypothetical protein